VCSPMADESLSHPAAPYDSPQGLAVESHLCHGPTVSKQHRNDVAELPLPFRPRIHIEHFEGLPESW